MARPACFLVMLHICVVSVELEKCRLAPPILEGPAACKQSIISGILAIHRSLHLQLEHVLDAAQPYDRFNTDHNVVISQAQQYDVVCVLPCAA